MSLPGRLDVQVVRKYRRRRLVAVSDCVVCGTQADVKHVRASQGWHMYTAFIESLNLAIRQHMAAVRRRVMTPCISEEGVRQQLALH